MDDTGWIKQRDDGEIRHLILNAAPANTLLPDRLFELIEVIKDAEATNHVRAIIISSALRIFSAGLDLKSACNFDLAEQIRTVAGLNESFLRLFSCDKPVLVARNGAAIAGGLFFVLSADYRLSTSRSKFGLAEVRAGVDFPIGPMEIARAMMSPNDLRRLMMRGQMIDVEVAKKMGFIDEIVLEKDLITHATRAAKEFAAIPPKAYASVKKQIRGKTIALIEGQMGLIQQEWFTSETRKAMTNMLEL